ncbi:hypothetical protein JCM11641_008193 [Rhodosporidiobolus odoratus]
MSSCATVNLNTAAYLAIVAQTEPQFRAWEEASRSQRQNAAREKHISQQDWKQERSAQIDLSFDRDHEHKQLVDTVAKVIQRLKDNQKHLKRVENKTDIVLSLLRSQQKSTSLVDPLVQVIHNLIATPDVQGDVESVDDVQALHLADPPSAAFESVSIRNADFISLSTDAGASIVAKAADVEAQYASAPSNPLTLTLDGVSVSSPAIVPILSSPTSEHSEQLATVLAEFKLNQRGGRKRSRSVFEVFSGVPVVAAAEAVHKIGEEEGEDEDENEDEDEANDEDRPRDTDMPEMLGLQTQLLEAKLRLARFVEEEAEMKLARHAEVELNSEEEE